MVYFPKFAKLQEQFSFLKVIKEANNYHPIFILTYVSKIVGKVVHVRQMKFFHKHKVNNLNQYGFQKKISIVHALLDVVTATYDNIFDKFYTSSALVDLRKAFDTVCHKSF